MKSYIFKFLFNNGKEESYNIGHVEDEDLNEVCKVITESFSNGKNAYLQLPCEEGLVAFIRLGEVIRVSVFEG